MQKSVNRHLSDPALDDIDHALGRPRDPMQETYRDHYCAGSRTITAAAMRGSPWWREGATINDGASVFFHVTDAGRRALALYLEQSA